MKTFILLASFLLFNSFYGQQQVEIFDTPGTTTWTAPANVTSVEVQVWGAGGGGGAGFFRNPGQGGAAGGGGGGGAYVSQTVTVIPGNTYNISIGAGGIAAVSASGGDGGQSVATFGSTTVAADGGIGGTYSGTAGSNGTAGAGGSAGDFSGGNGADGSFSSFGGGGGGSSAGPSSNGNNATSNLGATAPTGGGNGGNGGNDSSGTAGTAPGGGGGGGSGGPGNNDSYPGGTGGNGQIILTYTPIDQCNATASGNADKDNDGVSDICDLDDDNDGVLDVNECNSFLQPFLLPSVQSIPSTGTTNYDVDIEGGSFVNITSNQLFYRGGLSIGTPALSVEFSSSNQVPSSTALSANYTLTFPEPIQDLVLTTHDFDGPTIETIGNFSTEPTSISANAQETSTGSGIYTSSAENQDISFTWNLTSSITSISFTFTRPTSTRGISFALEVDRCLFDSDGDGISDKFDLDSDGDGISDAIEAGANPSDIGTDGRLSGNIDSDGVPLVANGGLTDTDSDGDGFVNRLDLDSDNDGIPDVVEAGGVDSDGDGVVDNFTDTNNDGIDDTIGASGLNLIDSDGDGIPNSEDLDSDNDGTPDIVEAGGTDTNNDGILDDLTDSDNDGLPDVVDGDVGNDGTAENSAAALILTGSDANNDGLADNYPNGGDFDGDGILNQNDLDSDGDGILDTQETGAPDANADGIADGSDNDGNGWNDSTDPNEGGTAPTPPNTDGTGEADYLDIDSDGDGIPDNVEAQPTSTYIAPSGTDADGDGIDDAYDNDTTTVGGNANNGITPENTDGTDEVDYLDTDSDNDGILDIQENGNANNVASGTDSDGDGLDDNFDSVADTTGSPLDVNDNIDTPNASTLGDEDADLGSGGDVDYRDIKDTDNDGIPDVFDLDDDNDGITDVDESGGVDPLADADSDGTPNFQDTDYPGFVDSNTDGINDNFDTDLDGVIDAYDLDSDNDGIPDIVEAGGVDSDGDGRVDAFVDTNDDGFDDNIAVSPLADADSDNDGIKNRLDLDSDNDGIPDNVEAQTTVGYIVPSGNVDRNGFDTAYVGGINPVDTEGDGIPDYLDDDSDNDGTSDLDESFSAITPSGTVGENGLFDNAETTDDYSDVSGLAHNGSTFTLSDTDNDVVNGADYDYRDIPQGEALFGTRIISSLQNGTVAPNKIDAYLNIVANNWGVVITRVNGTASIANPVEGMLVFDTSDNTFKVCTQGGATPIWRALR